jgi:hypothetical protein
MLSVCHEDVCRIVGIAPCILNLDANGGEGQIHASTALPPRKEPSVLRRLCGHQSRSGRCEGEKSNLDSP